MLERPYSATGNRALSWIALAGLSVTPLAADAADSTWLNTGADFNTAVNWSNGVPGAGNRAIFDSAAVANPNLSASLSIGQIHFSTADASGYELSASAGQSLTLIGIANTAILSTNTSGTNTISAPLILSEGNKSFVQAPGGELVVSGDIRESGGPVTLNIARTAAGGHTVTLSGNNSYTGGTGLSGAGGKLNIGSSTAIGTGALTLITSTHTVDNTTGSDLTLSNALNLNGVTFIFAGSSSMKMTGAIALGGATGARTITVSNNTLHLTGAITQDANPRALNKNGAGTLILDGPSNHSGVTTVSAGTLIINGDFTQATGAVSVNNGATLGGAGVIGGNTTVNSGGKLAPGASPGTLTFANDLTLASGSSLIFEGGDLVAVDGTLTLNDNWILTLGDGFQDGGAVTLFTYGTLADNPDLVPTFNIASLGFVPTGELSLTDTGSSIVLNGVSVIPEPASAALMVVGVAIIGLHRRTQS